MAKQPAQVGKLFSVCFERVRRDFGMRGLTGNVNRQGTGFPSWLNARCGWAVVRMNPRSQNRDRSLGAVSGAPGKLQIPRLPAVAQDDIVDLDPMRIAVTAGWSQPGSALSGARRPSPRRMEQPAPTISADIGLRHSFPERHT